MREVRPAYAWAVILLGMLLAATPPVAGKDVPFLGGRVNDLAGLLRPDTEAQIDKRLQELEKTTGAQVVVLTIESLDGDALEEYAHRVATTWKLGRADADDGVLLLVSRDDRKMRIEVGYGLEGTVPDAVAKRILDEIMRPRFRAGQFNEGISAGVDTLAAVIRRDPAALPPPPRPRSRGAGSFIGLLILATPLGVFSLLAFATKGRSGWVFWLFLGPFWFIVVNGALGWVPACVTLAVWLVLFPVLRILLRRTVAGSKALDAIESALAATASATAWSSYSGWGGGSSGGGGGWSGGGGFSGGGGSFGGGGASSGW